MVKLDSHHSLFCKFVLEPVFFTPVDGEFQSKLLIQNAELNCTFMGAG